MEAKETRILVVEDDFDAADAVRTILESEGYQVATADSAAKAWEAIHATRPHLLLLDVMMPTRTEGFQFVWELRGADDDTLRDLPIIVLSATHEDSPLRSHPAEGDDTEAAGEYLPVQAFLDTPVESRRLLAQVAEVLKGTQAQK